MGQENPIFSLENSLVLRNDTSNDRQWSPFATGAAEPLSQKATV